MNPTSVVTTITMNVTTNLVNYNHQSRRGRQCRRLLNIPIYQLSPWRIIVLIQLLLLLVTSIILLPPTCIDAFPIGKLLSKASLRYFVVRPFVRKLIITKFSNNKNNYYSINNNNNNPVATRIRFNEKNLKRNSRWRSPLFSNINNFNEEPNTFDDSNENDNLIPTDYSISDTTLNHHHNRGISQDSLVHHQDHLHHHHHTATTKANGITRRPVSAPIIVNNLEEYEDNNKDKNELLIENQRLLDLIHELEETNQLLRYELSNRIVIEQFEGEGRFLDSELNSYADAPPTGSNTTTTDTALLWCDELDDDGQQCPIEPTVSFGEALRDRAYWLVGLLILQSCSGIILARNEALLANHPFIIYFLTMLVGAGGNAGNQASVRVIRGLALGTLNDKTQNQFLFREFKMACALSLILSLAGFIRASAFRTPFPETIAVTASLFLIVFSSICLGAILPLGLKKLRIDPAHSSTTIQVIMDILGVLLAVVVSSILLDSPIGKLLITKLS